MPFRYPACGGGKRDARPGTSSSGSSRGRRSTRPGTPCFAAGAGRIGDYTRCSWYTAGTGTFLGGAGTDPAIGKAGREERGGELRVETVVPADMRRAAVDALVATRIRTRRSRTTSTRSRSCRP